MSSFRLSSIVRPLNYNLFLYPFLTTGLFNGKVIIKTEILQSTPIIELHSHKLNILNIEINGEKVDFQLKPDYEKLVIQKADKNSFGKGVKNITVNYVGSISNQIVGLYRSSYKKKDGSVRYIVSSKLEPTHARQAYPCFDEPNFKATYTVHLLKPKDTSYVALSNNPQASEEEQEDGIMVHFNETVPMSTYLSCFIVADFKYTESFFDNEGKSVPFRVYATPEQLEKTKYATSIGSKVMKYYIDYFDIPYPLPKLDMIAIPDFVSGAMEHWGLVTFRETALLYTNLTHSTANRQRVVTVIAHELAHMWFGNLVTLNWWNDLWLNEGFATFIEYKGAHYCEPKFGMMDQILLDTHSVMLIDATQASHPIVQEVNTPDQITEVFDFINYDKGMSILRMLENVVGEEKFRKGVTNYLKKFAFKNAVSSDLYKEIQETVGDSMNINDFMNTFTIQMGFPIINIKIEDNKYVLTQKRFLLDSDTKIIDNETPLKYKWSVPIKYITDKGVSDLIWFHHDESQIVISKPNNVSWIKFNPSQCGYYRVNYPENEWRLLMKNINEFSIADRSHLIEESFSIAESGDIHYSIPLELIKYLQHEYDFVPWNVAATQIKQLKRRLFHSNSYSTFQNFVTFLLKPIYENVSWNENVNDEPLKRLLRTTVLELACSIGYEDALKKVEELFNQWIQNNSTLSQDLRSVIYQYGLINAKEEIWNQMFDKFHKELDANEKIKLLSGLASIHDPHLIKKLLNLAKDETYIRGQDYFFLFMFFSRNEIAVPILWDYYRENWPYLVERFTLNDRNFGKSIVTVTQNFATNTKLEEIQQFFKKYPDAGAGTNARCLAIEKVKNNIKWSLKYQNEVETWLKNNKN